MLLERFYAAKQPELAALRASAEKNTLPAPFAGMRPDFVQALRQRASKAPVGIIAEFKRASPSAGVICEDLTVEDVARQYAVAGANCMSVLTEEAHFHGELGFLKRAAAVRETEGVPLPLLRKDFLFDRLQVLETAATPASAMLLIVRLTPDAKLLRSLQEEAERFKIACVVEVFDGDDLKIARDSGARIIQVNARDLESFHVDRAACLHFIRRNPPENGETWIAASGVQEKAHLGEAAEAGYDAVLVGTALMRGGAPGRALSRLLGKDGTERC